MMLDEEKKLSNYLVSSAIHIYYSYKYLQKFNYNLNKTLIKNFVFVLFCIYNQIN